MRLNKLRIGLLGHLQDVGHSVGQSSACALATAELLAERSAAAFLLLYSFIQSSELSSAAELSILASHPEADDAPALVSLAT